MPSANVRILEKAFSIDTRDLGVLKVPQEKVKTVIYKNPPLYPDDMIRTYTGTELNGVILNDPIRMDAEEIGGKISIAKSKILSIIW